MHLIRWGVAVNIELFMSNLMNIPEFIGAMHHKNVNVPL